MSKQSISRPPVYTHPVLEVGNGVCSTGHPLSAQAGVAIMKRGGNAFDALVGAAFTAFVMEPESCGIGGYGHISAFVAKQREFLSIDAYCRAPGEAYASMFEIDESVPPTYYGHPLTKDRQSDIGWLSIAVPGAVAGFCDTHALLGRLPLTKVMEPAIELAEAGVPVTFKHQIEIGKVLDDIKRFPDTARVLLPGGKLPAAQTQTGFCDHLDTGNLAKFLKRIAKRGKRAFHSGAFAKKMASYIRSHGGILSASDLEGYRPRVMREQPASYRGYQYVSCFDQVCYEALNILSCFDLKSRGADSFAYRHLTAEALALAFADSMTHYGDPDFVASPVNGLSHPGFAAERARLIRLSRVVSRPVRAGDPWQFDALQEPPERLSYPPTLARRAGTSQIAVADRNGNMASACVSIGSSYGSLIYVPELGVFMNNAMQNFDPRPEHPSHIAPGKMPIFAAPALVATRAGQARFAGSGSGGYRIEPGVLQTFMNHVDHGMPIQSAVDHPRLHCQGQETFVDDRIDPQVQHRLRRVGHTVTLLQEQPGTNGFGRISAVTRNPRSGALRAAGGPAWGTGVAGF